jgi:MFS family permease
MAQSATVLLISRIIQGLSSSIVYTIGLAVLVDTVGREEIGQWMGTALSSSSVGLIISPMLGGFVYFHAGYTAVLSMAVGLICVDIILRMLMIERKSARKYNQKRSNVQYGTFEAAQSETHDSENVETSDPSSPTQMESSTSTLSALRATPRDSEFRLPPLLTLLGSYRVLAAIYGVFVNVSVLASFDSVLPIFVKRTFNWTSLESGLIFLTVAVPALAGPLVGQLSDRFGPRPIAVFGCAGTAPFLVLLQLVSHDSEEQVVLLCGLLTLIGMFCNSRDLYKFLTYFRVHTDIHHFSPCC